jgi:hypothetical protein
MDLSIGGNEQGIDEDIIDVTRAHGSRKTEMGDLNRRRPQRENSGSASFRVAHEIHSDVDFHAAQQAGNVAIVAPVGGNKAIEGSLQSRAHVVFFVAQ